MQCSSASQTFATIAGCRAILFDNSSGGALNDWAAKASSLPAGVSYDAVQAGQCLAAILAQTCADQHVEPSECARIFKGSLAIASTCIDSAQCACGYCAFTGTTCVGTCQPLVSHLAACPSNAACPPGDLCVTGKCLSAHAAVGEFCLDQIDCPANCRCVVGADNVGVCKIIKKYGESCATADDCAGACKDGKCATPPLPGAACPDGTCAAGEVCLGNVNGQGKCKLSVVGDPCTAKLGGESSGECGTALRCVGPSGGKATCALPAGLGEACLAQTQCKDTDLLCVGLAQGKGKCQLLPGKGAACEPVDLVAGTLLTCMPPYRCFAAVCGDPPALGQPCGGFGFVKGCASGLTCDDKTGKCITSPGLGEPCLTECANGLTCNGTPPPGICVQACQ